MTEFKEFPAAPKASKLLGPSFIILALGLGSGEIILWPYLASNYGLGIVWGAIIGITFQFFINMEIERYALLKGESVFVGIGKIFKGAPVWFIISTFITFGLPGIVAASAEIMAAIFGFSNFTPLAITMLIGIGVILSAGKTVYEMMEKITKTIIIFGVPFIFLLAISLSARSDWQDLARGIIGYGNDYFGLPVGIALSVFFAAFAYSGAGGNLNLTQSIYIKEKGYGMGKYSQKISGLFSKENTTKEIKLSGEEFELNETNIANFRGWWKAVNVEHLFVFWFVGSLSMLLLMLLAYSTTYGLGDNSQGINFVINEGAIIGKNLAPAMGVAFLFVVSVMLFQTQLGVMDSTSRIMAENTAIRKLRNKESLSINLGKIYYSYVWAQILFGVVLFLFNIHEPKKLLVLAAILNAFAMFVHIALVSITNHKLLAKEFRPNLFRKIAIFISFLFFGFFSILVFLDKMGFLK